jgi:hypothetical protein
VWVVRCTASLIFRMDGICVVVHLYDFGRFDPLVLVLYGDMIIYVGCLEQLLMWCSEILACDVRDVGV